MRIRIPIERVGVVIGTSGRDKQALERKFNVKLDIDGKTGNIVITSTSNSSDPFSLLRARDTLMAIGRGFSSERAFRLFDEEVNLVIINLRDLFGRSDSDISRTKARIIGTQGKTRKLIEELTGANLCVYGYTVAIVGNLHQLAVAKEAIERLIRGDQHKNVYGFLYRKRRELKAKETELWCADNV
jgi:ribosomal RNA assembly protein